MKILVLLSLLAVIWGAGIEWKDYRHGVQEVIETKKPGLVLIYRPTCPACQMLNGIIQKSTRIEDLSKGFVMIRTVDGSEPMDAQYRGGNR